MRYLIIFLFVFTSCRNQTTNRSTHTADGEPANNNSQQGSTTPTESLDITGCYMEVLKRDTFSASLVQQGKAITGRLTFDNFEKDGSSGTVNGQVENGIIKLWYNFQSEGMRSVMQVWFKKDGDLLTRGLGDMEVRNDSSYFTNPMAIRFEGSNLQSIHCKNLPEKYK